MNYNIKPCLFFVFLFLLNINTVPALQKSQVPNATDSLPSVLSGTHADLLSAKLRKEAKLWFAKHRLPENKRDWEEYREILRKKIIEKNNVFIDPGLPLNFRELGTIPMDGYSIKNITFQTLPGVYATANLFV